MFSLCHPPFFPKKMSSILKNEKKKKSQKKKKKSRHTKIHFCTLFHTFYFCFKLLLLFFIKCVELGAKKSSQDNFFFFFDRSFLHWANKEISCENVSCMKKKKTRGENIFQDNFFLFFSCASLSEKKVWSHKHRREKTFRSDVENHQNKQFSTSITLSEYFKIK